MLFTPVLWLRRQLAILSFNSLIQFKNLLLGYTFLLQEQLELNIECGLSSLFYHHVQFSLMPKVFYKLIFTYQTQKYYNGQEPASFISFKCLSINQQKLAFQKEDEDFQTSKARANRRYIYQDQGRIYEHQTNRLNSSLFLFNVSLIYPYYLLTIDFSSFALDLNIFLKHNSQVFHDR